MHGMYVLHKYNSEFRYQQSVYTIVSSWYKGMNVMWETEQ